MKITTLVLLGAMLFLGLIWRAARQFGRRPDRQSAAPATVPAARFDVLVDVVERVLIVILAAAFAVAAWKAAHHWNRLMIIPEALTVLFVLFRRAAISVSTYPMDWALGVLGTMSGLLARPGGEAFVPEVASAGVILAGALISASAKLSLNTRFALAPANRGIQPGFAYAIVRHPMYAGYMVANIGFALLNPTPWNSLVYMGSWGLLVARIYREERWLSRDADYVAYAQTVRWRLFPWLY
jgi:protein-S-isoprenylcysteine O-methyltransferase Ste14